MRQSVKDQVIVITGGSSGYGKATARLLAAEGARVIITGRDEKALRETAAEIPGIEAYRSDATRWDEWQELFDVVMARHGRVDVLVNNAGGGVVITDTVDQKVEMVDQIIALNLNSVVYGSMIFGKQMRAQGSGTIVNISSTCAGRRLQDAYGRTKAEAEQELDRTSLAVTHLRPTMIYGRGSKEFEIFLRAVTRLPRVPIPGDGTATLRPVYVDDAIAVIIRAAEVEAAAGRTYDVAGPAPVSIDELVQTVARAQGRTAVPVHVPGSLALAGARLLGWLMAHPPINVDQVMAFLQDTVVDIEPARRELTWDPRPLEVGLAELFGEAR